MGFVEVVDGVLICCIVLQALIGAFQGFKGCLLAVSHDQHLITQVCNSLWFCGGNQVRRFDSNFGDYKQQALRRTEERQRQAQALAGKLRSVV